jgi:hypothetical protein
LTRPAEADLGDVRFDHEAALDAVATLRRAALKLESVTHTSATLAHEAQQSWRGRYRVSFDTALSTLIRHAHVLDNEIHRTITRILQAADDAQQEQAQRAPK